MATDGSSQSADYTPMPFQSIMGKSTVLKQLHPLLFSTLDVLWDILTFWLQLVTES